MHNIIIRGERKENRKAASPIFDRIILLLILLGVMGSFPGGKIGYHLETACRVARVVLCLACEGPCVKVAEESACLAKELRGLQHSTS